ncbi:MAG: DUF520 family protein [Gammaproteobacteria bacterium]
MASCRSKLAKRNIDTACLNIAEPKASGKTVRQEITFKQGFDPASSDRIVKLIKEGPGCHAFPGRPLPPRIDPAQRRASPRHCPNPRPFRLLCWPFCQIALHLNKHFKPEFDSR